MNHAIRNIALASIAMMSTAVRGQNPWQITAHDINPSNYYGVTAANGMIGLVSSPTPLKLKQIVLGGVWDIYGESRVKNFLHNINVMDLEVKFDGTKVELQNISNYQQTLDMRQGLFNENFDYRDIAHVDYRYTALRQLPYNMLATLTIYPHKDIKVDITNMLTVHESFRNGNGFFSQISNGNDRFSICTSTGLSPTGAIEEAGASAFVFEDQKNRPEIFHQDTRGIGQHAQEFTVLLKAGTKYEVSIIGSLISSVTHHDLRNEAERMTYYGCLQGQEQLWLQHRKAWEQLWKSDISIEGDAQSQQDVHSMLYHTYAFLREGSDLSVSPMGLSGLGYNGHVFWDAETWVFPAVVLLHPELAKSMIDYRYRRLETARQNAYMHGFNGAMFPWESSDCGMEDTPVHNAYGPLENHITADVAIAAWQYYLVTRDLDWLKERGWPIIHDAADFWMSRTTKDTSGNDGIRNIIGADEWGKNTTGGKNIDNDAYTNGAAKTVLTIAAKAAAVTGHQANARWEEVAGHLPFRKLPNGVTAEHDTYQGEIIKQADVNLLAYPLKIIRDKEQVKRDLNFYITRLPEKRTPAMSKSIFSILYGQLGDKQKSWQYFKESYEPNLNPPFRVLAEFNGGTNPYFITGAGGTLQSILMGFCGLDITDDGIFEGGTHLPRQWKSITVTGLGREKRTLVVKQ